MSVQRQNPTPAPAPASADETPYSSEELELELELQAQIEDPCFRKHLAQTKINVRPSMRAHSGFHIATFIERNPLFRTTATTTTDSRDKIIDHVISRPN